MAYASGERVQSIADHFGIAKSYVTMLVDRHGAQYGIIKRQHQPKRVEVSKESVVRPARLAKQEAAKVKRGVTEAGAAALRGYAKRGLIVAHKLSNAPPRPVTLPSVRGWT